jgi:phage terminase small subunit
VALSEREQLFCVYYVMSSDENAAEAARRAGYKDNPDWPNEITAHACRLMRKPKIQDSIAELGKEAFRGLLVPAVRAMRRILMDPKHPDVAKTAATVLSRLGYAETSRLDVRVDGKIEVNHTDQAIADLRAMKELGVPRAKLEEVFGLNGLPRFERMLLEGERKSKAAAV